MGGRWFREKVLCTKGVVGIVLYEEWLNVRCLQSLLAIIAKKSSIEKGCLHNEQWQDAHVLNLQ